MNKNIFYLIVIIFFLNSCQSVKDGLAGKKRNQSDEFLVEKKNPLTLPPEFENLPVPIENSKQEVDEKDFDISRLSISLREYTTTKVPNVVYKLPINADFAE